METKERGQKFIGVALTSPGKKGLETGWFSSLEASDDFSSAGTAVVAHFFFFFFFLTVYPLYAVHTSVSCMAGAPSVAVPGGRVLPVRGDFSSDSSHCSHCFTLTHHSPKS